MAALVDRSGELSLTLPRSWANRFPHLAASFSPRTVALLLASTRLVGMVCPGLHSIFSALSLETASNATPETALQYRVVRADPRVRLVDMDISSVGLRGTIGAF